VPSAPPLLAETIPTKFRYIDPETGKSVTSTTPPLRYQWEKKRTEDNEKTWFLTITGRSSIDHPSSSLPTTESSHSIAYFDIEKYCSQVSILLIKPDFTF
jgi:hypothetical protein